MDAGGQSVSAAAVYTMSASATRRTRASREASARRSAAKPDFANIQNHLFL